MDPFSPSDLFHCNPGTVLTILECQEFIFIVNKSQPKKKPNVVHVI